ncbi:MAG TPA: hypothetical protein VGO07_06875 [Candidatus Saccharimonadales bacterium]|jgi:hypothetical protein|nr:hypothetical protein [Candidatus Saccharimonadales bacterium]
MGLFGHGDDDKKDEPVVPAADQGAGQAPTDGGTVPGAPTPAAGGDSAWPAPAGDAAPQAPGADQSAGVPTDPTPVAPADPGASQWGAPAPSDSGADAGMASESADPAASAPSVDAPADPAAGAADGSDEPKVG